ncbi:MAG: NADH-quinone oxidoreductase subunit L [Bacteroidetes bacterium]|nr:NADH-quinone oxidoreductase subunit L [Bacteroidota bacterium]
MEQLVKLVPLFPLISFAIIGLLNRKLTKVHAAIFACTGVFLSFVDSILIFIAQLKHGPVEVKIFDWIVAGDFSASITFLCDHLSSIFLLVITGVGFLIHIFSVGYMMEDDGFRRFFAYLNLFIFFMLLLVLGNNFLVMFIGWEGVGFCSFMLIGFWFKEESNNNAAKKAFVMNRVGDLGFLIAMCLIFVSFGTLDFSKLFAGGLLNSTAVSNEMMTIITICLFVGAMGKSAQIPLYTWLPDAMAGPTPVSALIHAATMVTAGIYMVARTNFMFNMTPATLEFVAIIGGLTALLGASIGLFQNDIKKVLAYSTVSQLGLMFLALGLGAYSAAVFHVVTHAFFKALLFLGSGSVIHSMGGEQDIRKMGGLKKHMPITYMTFLIGTIAISGIPPLAGFFSKDQILAAAFEHNKLLFVLGMIVSLMTAFYMFRLLYLTFHGSFRGTHEQEHHLHESPWTMTMPLIILAIFSIISGFIGFPHALGEQIGVHNWFDEFLKSSVNSVQFHAHLETELLMMGVTTALIVLVILFARSMFVTKGNIPADESIERKGIQKLLYNKYYVDELYHSVFTRPVDKISAFFQSFIDNKFVDGLVNGIGKTTVKGGAYVRTLQSGNINAYAILFIIAIILIFFIIIF